MSPDLSSQWLMSQGCLDSKLHSDVKVIPSAPCVMAFTNPDVDLLKLSYPRLNLLLENH